MGHGLTGDAPAPGGMALSMEAGVERRVQTRLELEPALTTLGTKENGFATLSQESGAFFWPPGR